MTEGERAACGGMKESIMEKRKILKQIAAIMGNDAASCKDKTDKMFQKYESLIEEDMSDNQFLLRVNSYLCTFGLTGHLFFKKQGKKELPFRVHRYEDILYVTEVTKDTPLTVGDKIVSIDGEPVKVFYEKYEECFFGESVERQTPQWNFILKYTDRLGYIRGSGTDIKYWDVELIDWDNQDNKYSYKKITPSVSYLKIEDFMDANRISSILAENDLELRATRNLVIDVRGNSGGNDYACEPLLKYCLPKGKRLRDLELAEDDIQRYGQEILYSERNCDARIEIIDELIQASKSEDEKEFLENAVKELRNLRGKGFIQEAIEDDSSVIGDSDVEKVVILTDSSCCSAGDAFVNLFKRLPKVKVFGRPTQGILDYSNVAYALFDEYAFIYPTSRLLALDYGKGIMGKGIAVDEYIEWTPEHLERDVDLDYALNIIESENIIN